MQNPIRELLKSHLKGANNRLIYKQKVETNKISLHVKIMVMGFSESHFPIYFFF